MFTNQFFDLLLHLDDNWQVTDVRADHGVLTLDITVTHVGKSADCPKTASPMPIYDHAPERRWRHLDTMQYVTHIRCRLPRIVDAEGRITTVEPPWADRYGRQTYLFEHAVIDLLLATRNQTRTAHLMRCGFNTVNRIIHSATRRGLARRDLEGFSPHHLSLDEKSFKKGHKYVSVLSHPDSGCVLDVAEGRDMEAAKSLLEGTLTEEQRKGVVTVSMDMWKAYMGAAADKLPNADIVHDRFHLVKYLNEAIDKVRRREVKQNEELKESRYTLLKNPDNLTEKQRIQFRAIRDGNYQVAKAWQVRENFKELFGREDEKGSGLLLFLKWASDSLARRIREVDKVVQIFQDHLWGVVNALVTRFSNAMAERLNGKIQEIKTIGRGYRTFENFRNVILFFHGGLSLYPLK